MIRVILMGVQLFLAVLMTIIILPQESKKNQTQVFVEDSSSQVYFKPKGKEAFLKKMTIIVATLFMLNAIALVVVMK